MRHESSPGTGERRPLAVKTAVVLMAYGSPERLEDVPAYFADIRSGRPVRKESVDALVERYGRVGISPLNRITEAQRAALQRELGLPVYAGMKHWEPRIATAATQATDAGADHVIGLVLAPHYSRMSIGGYRERLEAALNGATALTMIDSWHDHPPFLDLVADRVREAGPDSRTHVVFTAHSLPERILAEGDPYRDQLLETAHAVAARLDLPDDRWSFAFQSASATGEPWLGPDIVDHLDTLHARGVAEVLVAPIGFVADHLEILWDIDVQAREKAQALGVELSRIRSMNDDPRFASALADLVRSRTK
jgi:protoporphyrin/coproporphyrin ferrochelatase